MMELGGTTLITDGNSLVVVVGDQAISAEEYYLQSTCFSTNVDMIDVSTLDTVNSYRKSIPGLMHATLDFSLTVSGPMNYTVGKDANNIRKMMQQKMFDNIPVLDILKYIRKRI